MNFYKANEIPANFYIILLIIENNPKLETKGIHILIKVKNINNRLQS